MNRFYILPMIRIVDNGRNRRVPKYVFSSAYTWSLVDYGSEDVCIIGVADPSTPDHNSWVVNPDVLAAPVNLDNNLTAAAVTTMQGFLETLNIPGQWVNTGRTYRQVLKVLIGLFQFAQRWNGLTRGSSPFKEGLNLNRTFNSLNAATKQRVQDCFDTLGVDRSNLTGSSTLREILAEFGQQFATRPISLNGETL